MSTRFLVSAVAAVAYGVVTEDYAGAFKVFAVTYGVTGGLDPNQKARGPRLDDLKIASGSYGAPVAYIEGHPRISGNIVWCTDKREIATETSQDGKGGPGVDTTLYTYEVDLIIMLDEKPGTGVRRAWSNGALIWSAADTSDDATLEASQNTNSWREIRFYPGGATQMPDPTYEAAVGVGNAPAYRDRSTVVIVGLNLGQSGQFPVLTFEVYSAGTVASGGGFTEAFDEGLMPYSGSVGDGYFNIVGGPYGNALQIVGEINPHGARSVQRIFPPTSFTKLTFKFRLDVLDSDGLVLDAPMLEIRNGSGVLLLAFWAARENAIDSLQRATVNVDGSPVYVSDVSPIVGHWHQVVIEQIPAEGLVRVTLTDLDGGTTVKITDIGGSFSAWPGEHLRFSTDLFFGSSKNPTCTFDEIVIGNPIARVTLDEVPLDEVVQRQWQRAGLDLAYLDVTALAGQFVRAMAVSQVTSPRQVIETLGSAYLFECVESGAIVKMVPRGGAPALTIPYDDLGATTGDPIDAFPRTRGNELEVAAQVSVKFANVDDDYQDGNESSTRLATGSSIVSTVEIPLGLTPTEAKRLAEVVVTDALASIIRCGPIGLTRKYAALEPTDVLLIVGKSGSTYRVRILKRTDSGPVATIEGVLDDATVIDSEAVTSGGYNSTSIVRQAPITSDMLLDTAILRDADNDQGFYWAAKPADSAGQWRGAVLYQSRDDVSFAPVSDTTDAAIMGTCTTTLGNWSGARVFDETNSVTVNIGDGTLSSVTRDDLLNDASINACAIGVDGRWELLQFRTASLISAGVYKLTGLLRGGRGTEWAMTGHAANEKFVLLRVAGMRRVLIDASAVAQERFYKDVSIGRSVASAGSKAFTDNAIGLKPFSPFDARIARNGSGDATITWQRRSRLATRTIGPLGISIPLGEESEAYAVDIFADGTYATVKRTLTATSTSVPYTSAQQVADFGSNQSTIYARVYQVSAVVGRGYALQAAA